MSHNYYHYYFLLFLLLYVIKSYVGAVPFLNMSGSRIKFCTEGSKYTIKKNYLFKLESKNIKIGYATYHAPIVKTFTRTKRCKMDKYIDANDPISIQKCAQHYESTKCQE
jgi:hypothetical protein